MISNPSGAAGAIITNIHEYAEPSVSDVSVVVCDAAILRRWTGGWAIEATEDTGFGLVPSTVYKISMMYRKQF
jgi:hypothetical protein